MVDAGVLSGEQLEHALSEQRRLERPLGEASCGSGWRHPARSRTRSPEQNGAPLRTEHGFALGLGLGTRPTEIPMTELSTSFDPSHAAGNGVGVPAAFAAPAPAAAAAASTVEPRPRVPGAYHQ